MNASTETPWKNAETSIGTVPNQASLFPRPVVLKCTDCGQIGYWYPADSKIEASSNNCQYDAVNWRTGHDWAVGRWNGNEPVAGAPENNVDA